MKCVFKTERRQRETARGFALLELMIVFFIVMVLSMVAGRAYTQYTARARLTECITKIHELRRLAWDYFHNEEQFANSTRFWQTYKGGGAETEFVYTTDYNNVKKNCNEGGDKDKGNGNDCNRTDTDNRANTGPGVAAPTSFEITCTHDHFPIADYVYVSNKIPNAIPIKAIPSP